MSNVMSIEELEELKYAISGEMLKGFTDGSNEYSIVIEAEGKRLVLSDTDIIDHIIWLLDDIITDRKI